MNPVSLLIRKNLFTNYLLIAVKLLEGVLVTRWLFSYLGSAYYGFWALLWTLFFYVLVLDFGFSKAAQKSTAEELYRHDITAYNHVVGAVFSRQALMAAAIMAGTCVAACFLPLLTRLGEPDKLDYCRTVMLVFGAEVAVTFPTGIFPEILVGLKKIYLRNYVLIAGKLTELFGVLILFWAGGSLLALAVFVPMLNFSLNLVMFVLVKRGIPGFKLRLRPDFAALRALADFSLFTYLYSLAMMVIHKTDRLLLGIFAGLNDIGLYQIGTRMPEMLGQMTLQYQDNVAPFTAQLCKEKRLDTLRAIIIPGLRLTAFLVSGGAVLGIVLTPELLGCLFVAYNPRANEVCRWILLSTYISISFRSFATRIMMMSGHHRKLCGVYWLEAGLNLVLSILLVWRIGLMGVVYGTVISCAVFLLGVMLPFTAKFLKMSIPELLRRIYLSPLLCALGSGAAVYALREILPTANIYARMLILGGFGGLLYLLLNSFDRSGRKVFAQLLMRFRYREKRGV